MKSTVKLAITFVLFASPAFAGDLSVKSLQVASTLKAGKPYNVTLPYSKSGSVKILRGCFFWSGEGPYCFPVSVRTKSVRLKLRTGNPNKYTLSGYVEYLSDGNTKKSNRVSAKIDVRP